MLRKFTRLLCIFAYFEKGCLREQRFKIFSFSQGLNERSNGANGANGSIPTAPARNNVEEDSFIGDMMANHQESTLTNRRTTDNTQEDYMTALRCAVGSNGNIPRVAKTQPGSYQPSCSRLDIIRMDGGAAEEEQDDLLRVVKGLLDKESQQNRDEQIRREWRMLAEAVDRVLFWSFLLITTVSTLLFLVILPFYHRGKFF